MFPLARNRYFWFWVIVPLRRAREILATARVYLNRPTFALPTALPAETAFFSRTVLLGVVRLRVKRVNDAINFLVTFGNPARVEITSVIGARLAARLWSVGEAGPVAQGLRDTRARPRANKTLGKKNRARRPDRGRARRPGARARPQRATTPPPLLPPPHLHAHHVSRRGSATTISAASWSLSSESPPPNIKRVREETAGRGCAQGPRRARDRLRGGLVVADAARDLARAAAARPPVDDAGRTTPAGPAPARAAGRAGRARGERRRFTVLYGRTSPKAGGGSGGFCCPLPASPRRAVLARTRRRGSRPSGARRRAPAAAASSSSSVSSPACLLSRCGGAALLLVALFERHDCALGSPSCSPDAARCVLRRGSEICRLPTPLCPGVIHARARISTPGAACC